MSYARSAKNKAARKERRAADRRLAAIERARRVRRARLRRLGLRVGAVVGCAAVVGGVVVTAQARARADATGPANMASDGILLTGDGTALTATRTAALGPDDSPVATVSDAASGVLPVTVYVDYRDPLAATFWSMNAAQVESWVTGGYATLEIHPLALLDGADVLQTPIPTPAPTSSATAGPTDAPSAGPSTAPTEAPADDATPLATSGDYSARAAGAVACVAQHAPDSVLAVHSALEAAVATLDADGLSDDELVGLVTGAGVTDAAVASCITDHEYTDWARQVTARAAESVPFTQVGAVSSSPVVLIDGRPYTGDLADPDAFAAFLTDVFTSLDAEGTVDPTPTPESTATPTS
ncbi:DsbA family protein [Cellulomonas gilvus]|uniref:Thioredoxin-like fold domain-containing protein n=1 Tax=Cellulomonas gilvus (strain ATCC 13127 / NRRL B-14078) TaxID=593907 RepID=F8A711_CELGA|nr:hypothetical protein [Cellulomonas gilvus]AEI12365.1 hypothetical protein Celgi_1859 [Cellulomonas gilvus ATCC 13127]